MSRVTLNSNIAALNARRRLGESTSALGQSFERLSSGLRINRASDDAAGLAVAALLNVDAQVYAQGVRNVNDGLGYLNVAEAATVELKGILIRMREVGTQSSNGTLGDAQRRALDEEVQALVGEYNRIVATTAFNGRSVFTGDEAELVVQAGYGAQGAMSFSLRLENTMTSTVTVGDGTFLPRTSYATGTNPFAVALGDLNGDGLLDLVNTDVTSNTLSVHLGNGDGTFQSRVTYATSSGPHGVTLGDLNGDGVLDVVNTNRPSSSVSVRLGNGDGTFQPRIDYATGSVATDVVLGDLNGDGVLDMVSTDEVGDTLSVRLGNGDGTFQSRTSYATGDAPRKVALGDVNGDGVLDIVNTDPASGTLSVHFGNGDGTFQARTSYGAGGSNPEDVALADINFDGFTDIVNTNRGNGTLTVRLGNGDGTFQAGVLYSAGNNPYDVVLGDLNGDGKLDVVSTAQNASALYVRFGNGDGTLQTPATSYTTGTTPRGLALGDLNGDGVLDLVNTDWTSNTLSVHLANTTTTTTTTSTFIAIEPISGIGVATRTDALAAQETIDGHLDTVNTIAGVIGAAQSRLAVAAETLRLSSENFRAAESRIVDADVAEESAGLVKNRILQQAGATIFTQANQLPALALQLLRQE